MSLTVTMETEPIEHAQSSRADPADPAKDSFVSFLRPAYNSEINVFPWSIFYGKQSKRWYKKMEKYLQKNINGKS